MLPRVCDVVGGKPADPVSPLVACGGAVMKKFHAAAVPVVDSNRMHHHVQDASYQWAPCNCGALHASSQQAN
jgi:hypothetical protein